jgi:hypothetical protein
MRFSKPGATAPPTGSLPEGPDIGVDAAGVYGNADALPILAK